MPLPAPEGPAIGEPGGTGFVEAGNAGAAAASSDGALPGTPLLAGVLPGNAAKNSFARRVSVAGSGKPAGSVEVGSGYAVGEL
jgi:hypothetical protein